MRREIEGCRAEGEGVGTGTGTGTGTGEGVELGGLRTSEAQGSCRPAVVTLEGARASRPGHRPAIADFRRQFTRAFASHRPSTSSERQAKSGAGLLYLRWYGTCREITKVSEAF